MIFNIVSYIVISLNQLMSPSLKCEYQNGRRAKLVKGIMTVYYRKSKEEPTKIKDKKKGQ